jgi:hypothetical protein
MTVTIEQTIDAYLSAREADLALGRAHSSQYNRTAHYEACDETSKWAYRMINHSDWTVELADKYYASAMEDIAYPVSC